MEKLYHYLWKNKLAGSRFRDVDGQEIEVLDPGIHNKDSGPDFFNSKIKIGDTEWAGNIEIHVKASQWFLHNHQNDPAYENVILHVVGISDRRVFRADGSPLPQIEVTLPEQFFRLFSSLSDSEAEIRCSSSLPAIPSLNKSDWLESLALERLQLKAQKVIDIHKATGYDWEQTCFVIFARGLGFGLNGDPFEMTAKSIPLKYLHHHSDNLQQIEAIIFGQAAMLDPTLHMFDEYFQRLCREYYFLAKKYGLKPIRPGLWKYSKTRPHNFPHRRLALLASASLGGFSLFSDLIKNAGDADSILKVFDFNMNGFWKDHFAFDRVGVNLPLKLSTGAKTLLAINVAVPLVYAYAHMTANLELAEKIVNLMTEFPAENNAVSRQWSNLGLNCNDASHSQALLHLKKEYCDKKKCIYCRLGHFLLRHSINPTVLVG